MKSTNGFSSIIALGAAAACLAAGPAASEQQARQAKVGEKAPAFTLKDTTGKEYKLSDYAGKIVVLEWINPECPFVIKCYKSQAMQEASKEARQLSKDVVWLAINTTYNATPEQNEMWIKQYTLERPILLDNDGTVGKLYDARRTPHMFVIDAEGVLRYQGAIDNNRNGDRSGDDLTNYVVNAIRQVVASETVEPDHVPPYGCSVKFAKK